MFKISSILLVFSPLIYFSGCASSRKAGSTPRLADMRCVNHDGSTDPRSIILALERADTVRVVIKNSSGDPVAQEYVTVLNFSSYHLESTFAPLIPGAYFVDVRTGNNNFFRYISVTGNNLKNKTLSR